MARRPPHEGDEAPAERREREDRGESTSGPPAEAGAPLVADEGVNEGTDEMLDEAPEAGEDEARAARRAPPQD